MYDIPKIINSLQNLKSQNISKVTLGLLIEGGTLINFRKNFPISLLKDQ